jgi:hypothetical protein
MLERFGHHAKPSRGQLQGWLSERLGRAEILPGTANVTKDHLHAVYKRARELKWPLLLNAAAFERFPEAPRKPEGIKNPARSWTRMLAAMPDDRASPRSSPVLP